MPKKGTEIVPAENLIPVTSTPDFTNILESESLSIAEKRKKVLEELGLRSTRRKYASPEERKEAAKKRRDERRAARAKVLEQYGLEPKTRGPKLTKAEKKKRRSERGKARRSFLREMAKAQPELAKKYGIDPSKFKI